MSSAEQFDEPEDSARRVIQEYIDGTREYSGDEVFEAQCRLNIIRRNRQTKND